MSLSNVGYNPATLFSPLTSGTYHYVTLTISGTVHSLYLDGSMIAQNTSAIDITNMYSEGIKTLYVGCAGDLSYGYTGSIDHFKIWNRVFTPSEINNVIVGNFYPRTYYGNDPTFLLWIDVTNPRNFTYSSSNTISSIQNLGYDTTTMAIANYPSDATTSYIYYLSSDNNIPTPCIQLGSINTNNSTYIITNIYDINNKTELTFFYVLAYDTNFATSPSALTETPDSTPKPKYIQLYGPETLSAFGNALNIASLNSTSTVYISASEQGATNNSNASNFMLTVNSVPNQFHILTFRNSRSNIYGSNGGQLIGIDGSYNTFNYGFNTGGNSNLRNTISSTLNNSPDYKGVMYFKEILGFTKALSDTEIQKMEGYLAWKWGIQSNLLYSHPYSTSNSNSGPK